MSKVTKLKVKQPDGNFSADIDLGAKASNVVLTEGKDLETKLGEVDQSIASLNSAGYITKEVNDLTNYTTTEDLETNYYKKSDVDSKLEKKADSATVDSTYAKKSEITNFITKDAHNLEYYYDKDQVDAKLVAAIHYKGDIATYDELVNLQKSAQNGDMYNITQASEHNNAGDNAIWNEDKQEWDILGGMVDLTDYAKKTDVPGLVDLTNYYTKNEVYNKSEVNSQIEGVVSGDLEGYLKTEDANKTYAKQTDLDNYVTTETADATYAKSTDLNSYETTAHAAETYAPKTDIPSLDGYMTTVAADAKYLDKETAGTTYATKDEIPNLDGYLTEEKAGQTYATKTALTTLDTNAVKVSGDQNIAGTKTFTSIPVLPTTDPTLDTQATSKGYVDKTVKNATPNVGKLVTNATEAQTASEGESFGSDITLHKIAKTGSYNDLNEKPTIPTAVSALTNDAHYVKVEKAENEEDALTKSSQNPDILYYWTE